MKKVTAREFERQVLEIEEVSIVLRCDPETPVDSYDYVRKAAGSTTISEFLQTRIIPRLGDIKYEIISSDSVPATPHGRTKLDTHRESFKR